MQAKFRFPRPAMRLLASFFLVLGLAGCGGSIIHRIDIQQGNIIAPETFLKLKEGMSRADVKTLLGTPLLTDVFHANRWDYYFRNEKGGRLVEQNRFSVHFANEKVVRIEGGPTPSAMRTQPPATASAPAAPAAPAPSAAPAAPAAASPAPAAPPK